MRHTSDVDHVISQGRLRDGGSRVDYYTTMPAPTQWIAVGVLVTNETKTRRGEYRRMLVGNGRDEASAIEDLRQRFAEMIESRRDKVASERKPSPAYATSDVATGTRFSGHVTGLLDGPIEQREADSPHS